MLFGTALSPAAFAQVSLTTMGTAYTQNFDTLASSGTTVTWTDNTTLAGWYYTRSPTAATTYTVGAGTSTGGALYSFGVAGTHVIGERALGSVASSSNTYFYGARFVNNTGATITSLSIQYTGEEWRTASTAPGKLQFQYQIASAGTITGINAPSTGWTAYTALDFAGPNVTTGNAAVDGNAAGNRTALTSVLNVSIAAGQEIWLRWQDSDDAGSDAGLAIDDFSITPNNQPFLSISDASCPEGNAGTLPCAFTVSIPAAFTSGITFDITTQDGTAIAGTDYQTTTQVGATIPAGSTTFTFNVPVIGNTTIQPNRTFNVQVSNLSGAILQDGTGVGTIVDDDAPSLSINNVSQLEGNAGTTTFEFTVSLSSTSPTDVTFDIATQDGTATAASGDYVAQNLAGQTITAGNTTYTFDVAVNGDTTAEPDENFKVNLTNISAGAKAGQTIGTGTILDDDAPSYSIMDIQGHGARSPLAGAGGLLGSMLKTPSAGHTNVVTAVSSKGFFMQDTVGDNDPTTSDGIFVFTGTSSNPAVTIGDLVTVAGRVQEFSGSTEIAGSPTFTVVGHNLAQIPTPYDLSSNLPTTNPTTGICMGAGSTIVPPNVAPADETVRNDGYQASNFACLDGMLVTMSHGIINAPTPAAGGSGNTIGGASNTGFSAVAGGPRSFRRPGIGADDINHPLNAGVATFYGNPELVQIYYNGVVSLPSNGMPVASGMSVGGVYNGGQAFSVVGVVQGFVATPVAGEAVQDPTYEIYPRAASDLALIGSPTLPVSVADPIPNKLTVGSQNGLHFFNNTNDGQDTSQYADTCNNPATSTNDTCPTSAQYDKRLNKMSLQIRTVLKAPLVQVMQEIESYSVASDIAGRIALDSGGALQYHPYLIPGNDPGGINIAILVRNGVTVNSVTQIWANALTSACSGSGPCLLNDRPPLLLDATYQGYHFRVLAIYDRSLNGLGDIAGGKDYVGRKRREEAEQVATIVQALQTTGAHVPLDNATVANIPAGEAGNAQQDAAGNITPTRDPGDHSFRGNFDIVGDATVPVVVVGDFNAYEFTDGYVDVTGTIMGTVDTNPAHSVYPPTGGYVAPSPTLFDTGSAQTAADHYSYTFNSFLQEIDHILVTSVGQADFVSIGNVHGDADVSPAAPDALDGTTARRTSDHDGQVVTLGWVVTPSSSGSGTISPATVQTVSSAQPVVFTLTPSPGFAAKATDNCKTDNGGGALGTLNAGAYTLPAGVTKDCLVSITFVPQFTVSTNVGPGGSVDAPSHLVNQFDVATFTFTPDPDYEFVSVNDDCGGSGGSLDPGTGFYVTSVITKDCTVTATFGPVPITVTANAGANGTVDAPSHVIDAFTTTTFTFTPNTGYHVATHFDDCGSGGTTSGSFNSGTGVYTTGVITVTCTVSATFAKDAFTLTYTAGSNGSITGTSPQTVNYGDAGTAVTAVPAAHYHFVKWSDNSTANPRTDSNVTAAVSVTAQFAIDTFTLTYTAGANGSITGTTPQTVDYNTSGTAVTAVPAAHYHFVKWSDNSTANPRTDSNVSADVSVTAQFAIDTFTLTYAVDVPAHGSITGTTPQTVDYNTSGSAVTATPAAGYHFVKWSDNSTSNPRTDTNVTVDISVTAIFSADYVPLLPGRLMDTRIGPAYPTIDNQFAGEGALAIGETRTLKITGRGGVPNTTISAVAVNLVAINPTGSGFITVWSGEGAMPNAGNLNLNPGLTLPNLVISKVSASGEISIYNGGTVPVDITINLQGYFPADTSYVALSALRFLDTRTGFSTIDGNDQGGGPLASGLMFDLPIANRGPIPGGSIAGTVVLNVTAVNPSNVGFVTVWPHGVALPLAGNLNLNPGRTTTNLVIAKLGSDGDLSVYNGSAGGTDLVANVQGWFPASSGYTGLTPARLLDTRPGYSSIDHAPGSEGQGPLASTGQIDLAVINRAGVPSTNVGAVVLKLTAVDPTNAGYITVWPAGDARPNAGNLNLNPGITFSNVVIAKVGANGKVSIFNGGIDPTNIVIDVQGWFPGGP